MKWIVSLLTNRFLVTAVSSWLLAQVFKTVLYAITNKKLDISRLFGDGGMPSGHSATVTSLAVVSGLHYGADSFAFALSAVLAIIVCHDATGVRQETGKQAFVINELRRAFEELSEEKMPEVKLKEFVGHTPIQVMAGILLGICNAFFMHWLLF